MNTYYGKGRSPRELEIKKIKSLGYLHGIDCQDSLCWEPGMNENFESNKANINEIKEIMMAFKIQNTLETISEEDLKQYKEILTNNYYVCSQENLKAFLDGYLDSINSDLLKACFEYYDNEI